MRYFLAVILLFLANAAFGESYFVKPTTGASLPPEQVAGVTDLVIGALHALQGAQPISIANDEKSADFVLESKVVKIGSAYLLMVAKTKGGKVVRMEQAKATTLEDMDVVATRVVRAAVNEKKFEKDTRVNDVTEDQVTRGTRRTRPVRQFFISLGPASTYNMNSNNAAVFGSLGHTWAIDAHFAMNMAIGGVAITDTSGIWIDGHLDLQYYFNENSNAPYVEGIFGYGTAYTAGSLSDNLANGFIVGTGAGIKLFRASQVNLGLGLRYQMMLDANTKGNPSILTGYVTFYSF